MEKDKAVGWSRALEYMVNFAQVIRGDMGRVTESGKYIGDFLEGVRLHAGAL